MTINKEAEIRRGFSLSEFLIAVGILLVVVGLSIIMLRGIQPGLELRGTARDLVTDLRYAQQLAVSEQVSHGLLFSTTTEDKYQIIKHEGTTSTIKEVVLPEGVNFKQISPFTGQEVRFNPYGAVEGSESGTITLENIKQVTLTVEVRPSGFVRILD